MTNKKITKTLRTAKELIDANLAENLDQSTLQAIADKYTIAISPHLLNYMQHEGIKRQFVPSKEELNELASDMQDPIGDKTYSPLRGIIHRYPDRCLLQPVNVCPVYCRFCFRRETVGKGNPALTPDELNNCFNYIAGHPEIWEVILSGGDPLILKPQQLATIITKIDEISHVDIIRIHTRVPIVEPHRINAELLAILKLRKPIYIVLHINHPDEFTKEAIEVIDLLADNGIVLLGQSVLLKGINDNITTLGQLMRNMVKYRIKPYYLHHLDLAKGTNHFRTSIADGQRLMTELRGHYSGLCQPQYVLDIPGGAGKSPIGPNYLHKQDQGYTLLNYLGQDYSYSDS